MAWFVSVIGLPGRYLSSKFDFCFKWSSPLQRLDMNSLPHHYLNQVIVNDHCWLIQEHIHFNVSSLFNHFNFLKWSFLNILAKFGISSIKTDKNTLILLKFVKKMTFSKNHFFFTIFVITVEPVNQKSCGFFIRLQINCSTKWAIELYGSSNFYQRTNLVFTMWYYTSLLVT